MKLEQLKCFKKSKNLKIHKCFLFIPKIILLSRNQTLGCDVAEQSGQ